MSRRERFIERYQPDGLIDETEDLAPEQRDRIGEMIDEYERQEFARDWAQYALCDE